jgi:hypothetical protein
MSSVALADAYDSRWLPISDHLRATQRNTLVLKSDLCHGSRCSIASDRERDAARRCVYYREYCKRTHTGRVSRTETPKAFNLVTGAGREFVKLAAVFISHPYSYVIQLASRKRREHSRYTRMPATVGKQHRRKDNFKNLFHRPRHYASTACSANKTVFRRAVVRPDHLWSVQTGGISHRRIVHESCDINT